MDAIVHVVRCFVSDDIIHVEGSVDPARDIETINLELIFSDIETAQRRLDKAAKALKGDKSLQGEVDFLKRLIEHLEKGLPARYHGAAFGKAGNLRLQYERRGFFRRN